MKIYNLLDETLLNKMVEDGYVNVNKHPDLPLYIYNYSKGCQAKHVWNDVTEACRGLIVDSNQNIIARPFKKFYNYEELINMGVSIPDEDFQVYEKLDGSLGILYFWNDKAYIATRGSFCSDMAIHATQLLNSKYDISLLDKSKTYLFEIIYPEDAHIINYKDTDEIFLLAVIDIKTGEEYDISNWGHIFKCAERYDGFTDYTKIRDIFSDENREGFVIKFKSGFRMKLKFAKYWELYSLKSGFTPKQILQHLIDDDKDSINKIMNMFDEERQIYYQNIIDNFTNTYNDILEKAKSQYKEFDSDKEAAAYFGKCDFPGIMFCLRKNKDVKKAIWNLIKKNKI